MRFGSGRVGSGAGLPTSRYLAPAWLRGLPSLARLPRPLRAPSVRSARDSDRQGGAGSSELPRCATERSSCVAGDGSGKDMPPHCSPSRLDRRTRSCSRAYAPPQHQASPPAARRPQPPRAVAPERDLAVPELGRSGALRSRANGGNTRRRVGPARARQDRGRSRGRRRPGRPHHRPSGGVRSPTTNPATAKPRPAPVLYPRPVFAGRSQSWSAMIPE